VPEVVAQALTHYRCTYWTATTTMIIALLNLPSAAIYDFSSLRFLWTGGAPISVELQDRIKALAPHAAIGEGYGLSESASQGGACTPPFRHKPGFVGIPQIGVEMKIVDEETGTHEMPPNEPGEIIIKAPTVMRGYWNRPEETEQMLRDGWLYTKDTGSMDEEGYVKFLGRTREMIKCSGFSVFPAARTPPLSTRPRRPRGSMQSRWTPSRMHAWIPSGLLAATQTPTPEPQMRMPRGASPPLIARATRSAKSG